MRMTTSTYVRTVAQLDVDTRPIKHENDDISRERTVVQLAPAKRRTFYHFLLPTVTNNFGCIDTINTAKATKITET